MDGETVTDGVKEVDGVGVGVDVGLTLGVGVDVGLILGEGVFVGVGVGEFDGQGLRFVQSSQVT
jgi:hypothetical protein